MANFIFHCVVPQTQKHVGKLPNFSIYILVAEEMVPNTNKYIIILCYFSRVPYMN